jgi:hypothetical protein
VSARIFVSYRRLDSAGYTGRLSDRLALEFGHENLFLDVDNIPLGVNFVKYLRDQVDCCAVLLAVIGPLWLKLRDENDKLLVNKPNDFVRVEIAAALERGIPVVPVLVDGGRIPRKAELPKNLKAITDQNAIQLRHASFHRDVNKLVVELKSILSTEPQRDLSTVLHAVDKALTPEPKQTTFTEQQLEVMRLQALFPLPKPVGLPNLYKLQPNAFDLLKLEAPKPVEPSKPFEPPKGPAFDGAAFNAKWSRRRPPKS